MTKLMRRAVALDQLVFDPEHPDREVVLRDWDSDEERVLVAL